MYVVFFLLLLQGINSLRHETSCKERNPTAFLRSQSFKKPWWWRLEWCIMKWKCYDLSWLLEPLGFGFFTWSEKLKKGKERRDQYLSYDARLCHRSILHLPFLSSSVVCAYDISICLRSSDNWWKHIRLQPLFTSIHALLYLSLNIQVLSYTFNM